MIDHFPESQLPQADQNERNRQAIVASEGTHGNPADTSTTCTTSSRSIAVQLRRLVRESRELEHQHGAQCRGHPVQMGHMLALRIADLLENSDEEQPAAPSPEPTAEGKP